MDGLTPSHAQHDAPVGPLTHCQITGSEHLVEIIDLGAQPPCDALLDSSDQLERSYPLRLMLCPESGLAQLDYVVDGREIYPPSYPYRSGISKPLADYQRAFADRVVAEFGVGPVVDIGSNDGTLLTGFKRNGCSVIGVEPTDIANIARAENGINTIQEFFTEATASRIGPAHIVTMTNVFAHMAGLGEVMRGVCRLIGDDGIFITESHYLLDVLEKNQFDTIYHEHIRTYSLKSLVILARLYGLEVFHVERGERYGGNIRAYISAKRPVRDSVLRVLIEEDDKGLFDRETWADWSKRVLDWREVFMATLHEYKADGKTIAGCSAPGRASTLLNFCGVKPDLMAYTGELHNSLKLGKFMPGSRIPIVSNQRLIDEQPNAIALLAWHYAEPIIARLRSEGIKSDLIVPLPEVRIVCV